jgi:diguanylate cyclase (GGDEF)-like protein/PAS domain S-box-containing protein
MDARPPARGGTPRDDEWTATALLSAFTHAPIGMAVCTTLGDVVEVNRALCELVGLEAERLRGGTLFDVTYPEDRADAAVAYARLQAQRSSVRHETRLVRADGAVLPVLVSASWVDSPGPAHLVMHVQDLTDVKAREHRLRHQATHDALTGLVNRELFLSRLGRRRRASDAAVMVLYVDLDGFKPVNDRWGHATGDQLLALLAERLLGLVRSGDTVARLGGDEFALLCDVEAGGDVAADLARRVVAAVHQPFVLDAAEVTVTASVGGAVTGQRTAPKDLLHAADQAMYRAKAAGGDRFVVTSL